LPNEKKAQKEEKDVRKMSVVPAQYIGRNLVTLKDFIKGNLRENDIENGDYRRN
jgi:hypothetical protein